VHEILKTRRSYVGSEAGCSDTCGEEPEVDELAGKEESDVEKDFFLRLSTWLGSRTASFRGGETSVCITHPIDVTCFLITTLFPFPSLLFLCFPSSPPALLPPHGCCKCNCRPLYLCYSSLLLWWVLINKFSGQINLTSDSFLPAMCKASRLSVPLVLTTF